MKTKISILNKLLIILFVLNVVFMFTAFGQGNTYKTDGNNNGTFSSKLGWKNKADLNIITNDSARVVVKKDGDVVIKKNLVVEGKLIADSIHVAGLTCDSLKITKYLNADSIHVRSIRIGAHSLYIGSPPSQSQIGTQELIQSSTGVINLGGYTPLGFSDIKIGIGTTTPNNKLQVKDLINFDDVNNSTYLGYLAGNSSIGSDNTFVGNQAGYSTTSGGNSFFGSIAGRENSTGYNNSFFGSGTGYNIV